MGTDGAALHCLWREKRGEAEPEDLSGNLIVQLGVATEALNRNWYERNTADPFSSERRQGSTVKNRVFSAATHF